MKRQARTPTSGGGAKAADRAPKAQADVTSKTTGQADHGTVQDHVLASIREAILTGSLPPGARLRQEKLAGQLGTSRIPVREALRALEYEGLVSSIPHRGFTVTELDPDVVEELYDLRILLEGHAIRLAVPLMTDDDQRILDDLSAQAMGAPTADAQLAARERYYLTLFSITGRHRLVGLISRLRQEVARFLRWPTLQHGSAHHERFFVAIRAGDAEGAANQLATHYRRVATLIRRYLRDAVAAEHRGRSGAAIDTRALVPLTVKRATTGVTKRRGPVRKRAGNRAAAR